MDLHELALCKIADKWLARRKAAPIQPLSVQLPRRPTDRWDTWQQHPEACQWHTYAEIGAFMGRSPEAARHHHKQHEDRYQCRHRRIMAKGRPFVEIRLKRLSSERR